MHLRAALIALTLLAGEAGAQPPQAAPGVVPAAPPEALVTLAREWRQAARADVREGVPDYGPAGVRRMAADLARYRARLAALDSTGWPVAWLDDARLLRAEMDGLQFDLDTLRPWARDPGFYRTIFAEQSDVPAHEGPNAAPTIDLFAYAWPLSPADDRRLAEVLAAVPKLLATARTTLAPSQARDLWAYGDRTFREQGELLSSLSAGTLEMRTLDGRRSADMRGASPALRRAIAQAKAATEDFAAWVAAEAPKRTGPSGVGKAAYDWHARHVQLSPYGWDAQVLLQQRELVRALASLRLEEARNRTLPPIVPIDDPAAYRAMAEARTRRFYAFLVSTGLVPDRPYFRAALEAQTSRYVAPADRDFFSNGTALDPLPLLSHSTHWIELARLKHEPNPDPIRRDAPLFNLWADRSEGFATAMEEIVMQAGLYDDTPHVREIVWIMLANRAARGLASLHVQANEMTLAEAGRFHAGWTPRNWSRADSALVGFEQLLYLRQPGYGPSYVLGKIQVDGMLAAASHDAEQARRPFSLQEAWAGIIGSGILPPALIAEEIGRSRHTAQERSPAADAGSGHVEP